MEKRYLTPAETVRTIVDSGKRVLTQSRLRTLVLSLLAGFYIAFGAQLATVLTQDAANFVGKGIAALLGGSVFSLGLMLVVICGAELFTGNSLLTSSALEGEISWGKLLENWSIVILGVHRCPGPRRPLQLAGLSGGFHGYRGPGCDREDVRLLRPDHGLRGERLRAFRCQHVFHPDRAAAVR
jgi:hypothetical protein